MSSKPPTPFPSSLLLLERGNKMTNHDWPRRVWLVRSCIGGRRFEQTLLTSRKPVSLGAPFAPASLSGVSLIETACCRETIV
jgi:hypothetical protein